MDDYETDYCAGDSVVFQFAHIADYYRYWLSDEYDSPLIVQKINHYAAISE